MLTMISRLLVKVHGAVKHGKGKTRANLGARTLEGLGDCKESNAPTSTGHQAMTPVEICEMEPNINQVVVNSSLITVVNTFME